MEREGEACSTMLTDKNKKKFELLEDSEWTDWREIGGQSASFHGWFKLTDLLQRFLTVIAPTNVGSKTLAKKWPMTQQRLSTVFRHLTIDFSYIIPSCHRLPLSTDSSRVDSKQKIAVD